MNRVNETVKSKYFDWKVNLISTKLFKRSHFKIKIGRTIPVLIKIDEIFWILNRFSVRHSDTDSQEMLTAVHQSQYAWSFVVLHSFPVPVILSRCLWSNYDIIPTVCLCRWTTHDRRMTRSSSFTCWRSLALRFVDTKHKYYKK